MTGPRIHCERLGEASLYVLGELPSRQQESFARHLRGCDQCAEEVELLQQAADAVPLLASRHVPPPEELEAEPRLPALTVAVGQQRQRSVAADQQRQHAVAAGEQRQRSAAAPRASSIQAGVEQSSQRQQELARPMLHSIPGGATAGSRPRAPRLALGGRRLLQNPVPKPAIIGFLALAIIAVATLALSHRAASVRYAHIQAGWNGGGAALKLDGNSLELLVLDMPKPARGSGYQVWLGDRLTRRLEPTRAWLHLNGRGEAGVNLPGDYHDWFAIAVYVEPLRGPFTDRSGAVVVGDLRHVR